MPVHKPISIQIERKDFAFEIKSVDEDQGIVHGYLSVFNNVDSSKDRVRPGAFKKTITDGLQRKSNQGKKFLWPVLWMHDPEKPIGGVVDAIEDQKGLLITAQLDISTNEHGIPLNPLAMSVFSGFKQGYIDSLSIGYKAIQKSYDNQGIRDLSEIQLFESSAVTMLFAANELAQVTGVKNQGFAYVGEPGPELVTLPKGSQVYPNLTIQLKTASGGSFPLADRNTPWSKSKAIKDIEAATGGDWSKAGKYFFWSAVNPTTEADLKLPFVAKSGGKMKAIPQAIISAAAAVQGARGGVQGIDDLDAVKSKIASYYSKMGMTPPWSSDKGKNSMLTIQHKDFNDRYREEQIKDWKNADFQNLVIALQAAIMDIFMIGDEPQIDVVDTILNGDSEGSTDPGNSIGFIDALKSYVQKGIDLNVTDYIADENSYFGNVSNYGYMSRNDKIEGKAGAVVSSANADRMNGHVGTLMQCKDMINSVADDITHYITGNDAYVAPGTDANQTIPNAGTELDAGKTARFEPLTKALKTANQPLTSTDDAGLQQLEQWLRSQIATNSGHSAA